MEKVKNIVDISAHYTSKDIYYVAKSMENKKSRILVTNSLKKAKERVESEKDNYYVYNSKGKILYRKTKVNTMVKINIGQKINADGINIYDSPNSTIPISSYHGTLVVVDDVLYRNKYKLQTIAEYPFTYYCNSDDVKKYIGKIYNK